MIYEATTTLMGSSAGVPEDWIALAAVVALLLVVIDLIGRRA